MKAILSSRVAYGKALAEIGARLPEVAVLDADLAKATQTAYFAAKFPERFFDMGIAEQNMMTTAAGMATFGLIPFVSTFAVFASLRAGEQLRNMIAYPKLNVKIVATHAGIENGGDGGSHQSVEDIAVVRAIPNMTVVAPADHVATAKAVETIARFQGPVYMRIGRADHEAIYDASFRFEIGKSHQLRPGNDLTIIAIGNLVAKALQAADQLAGMGYSVRVIDMYSLKPLDETAIVKAARETRGIITAEDHNIIGGLGSAVAEVLAEHQPAVVKRIGLVDCFGQSGDCDSLMEYYGLTAANIVKAAQSILGR